MTRESWAKEPERKARLSVSVSTRTVEAVKELAKRHGVSVSRAVEVCISKEWASELSEEIIAGLTEDAARETAVDA